MSDLTFRNLEPNQESIKDNVSKLVTLFDIAFNDAYRLIYDELGIIEDYECHKMRFNKNSFLSTLPVKSPINLMFDEVESYLDSVLVYWLPSDDDENENSLQITLGYTFNEDGSFSWNIQTGDNSYTGNAYGHKEPWLVTEIFSGSTVNDIMMEFKLQLNSIG
jgi:hypothetical protein